MNNKNPYEILGVASSATDDEIKSAYRKLAKKYHPDNYVNSPLKDVATEKMAEINAAYDQILNMRKNGGQTEYNPFSAYQNYNDYGNGGSYSDVRRLLSMGRIIEAEEILDGVLGNNRNAEWFYLKGRILYSRGFLEQAKQYFAKAHQMDPNNDEYYSWLNGIAQRENAGMHYRTINMNPMRSLCTSLLCLQCLCGGRLPCYIWYC